MESNKQVKCQIFSRDHFVILQNSINEFLQKKLNCSEVEIIDIKFCVNHDPKTERDWYNAMIIYR